MSGLLPLLTHNTYMKTIRTNCFETNSSSTHSFTVSAPTNLAIQPSQTFLPNSDGVIAIQLGRDDPENSLRGKLKFLLTIAHDLGDQVAFDRVISVVQEFTKIPVKVSMNQWDGKAWQVNPVTAVKAYKEGEDMTESIEDEYYAWTREYGHGSVGDFVAEAQKCLKDEQTILTFIFTGFSPFDSEAHYDG